MDRTYSLHHDCWLVRGCGRLLLVMAHGKNGRFGDAADHNRVLVALPSSLRLSGTGGVSSLVVYYSGSVTPGTGIALGTVPGAARRSITTAGPKDRPRWCRLAPALQLLPSRSSALPNSVR